MDIGKVGYESPMDYQDLSYSTPTFANSSIPSGGRSSWGSFNVPERKDLYNYNLCFLAVS